MKILARGANISSYAESNGTYGAGNYLSQLREGDDGEGGVEGGIASSASISDGVNSMLSRPSGSGDGDSFRHFHLARAAWGVQSPRVSHRAATCAAWFKS